jgi:hypothetical protein
MNEYTDNYTDKSILTTLSLFCKSDLLQTVLQFFSSSVYSAGLLCINFFCHSALLQLTLLFCSAFNFTLHICSISYCASSPFPFLQFHSFSSRTTNLSHSVSFSFIHTSPTVPLRISLGKTRTTVLATETLTDSQS